MVFVLKLCSRGPQQSMEEQPVLKDSKNWSFLCWESDGQLLDSKCSRQLATYSQEVQGVFDSEGRLRYMGASSPFGRQYLNFNSSSRPQPAFLCPKKIKQVHDSCCSRKGEAFNLGRNRENDRIWNWLTEYGTTSPPPLLQLSHYLPPL